jgi:FkbM family methyltransferase
VPKKPAVHRRWAYAFAAVNDARRLLHFIWNHPEVAGHRGSAVLRALAWQVWQRTVRRPWLVSLSPTVKFKCHPHSASGAGVLYCRYPEWREMRFLLDVLQRDDHVVDVGTKVGVYTLLAATVPGTRVWAFEPSSQAAGRAEANIRLNRLEERCTLQRVGVGRAAARGFITTGMDTMNRLAESNADGAMEEIGIVTLDDAVPEEARRHVAVIKIDVDGDELAVLEGATDLLEQSGAIVLVEPNEPRALSDFLARSGYLRYGYEPASRELVRGDVPLPGEVHAIYVRDIGSARARLARQENRAPVTVFAPTLSSHGGYHALPGHLGEIAGDVELAIVGDESAFRRAMPDVRGEVVEASGHFSGARALRRHARTTGRLDVVAVQNPVLPVVPLKSSLMQNHVFVTPWSAFRLQPDPRYWPALLMGTFATALQVRRSAETVVLNSSYPAYWERWTRVRVKPNSLGADTLGFAPAEERLPVIAAVTSFYRFRGLEVALRGFQSSDLAAAGWRMVVHAAPGDPRYESRCRRLAATIPGVRFATEAEPARGTMATSALACFPSRIEGSSIAFLEALLLKPTVIAFDGPHFRQAVDAAVEAPQVEWVTTWDPAAWGAALSLGAARAHVSTT